MKKLIALTGACLFSVAGEFQTSAQQLPNFGFNLWKAACGSTEAIAGGAGSESGMRQRPGQEPENWNGSSVNQRVLIEKQEVLVFKMEESGNTYAQIKNKFVGVSTIGSTAPGFLNFGTPWVNASMDISNCDGGVYGGVAFNNTPDALSAKVRRTDKNDEQSHLIAYFWNGSFTSKVGQLNNPTEERTDVDRAIWNESQTTGELVAKCDKTFSYKDAQDWTTMMVELEYVEGAGAPEKMNVVISAGDYWNRSKLLKETSLDVDDVNFVYYSRLASLTIGGVALEGFSSDKYEYTVNGKLPKVEDVAYTLLGSSPAKTVDVAVNEEAKTLTLTVTNTNTGEGVADIDGKNTHVYTINYVSEVTNYPGYLNIEMSGSQLAYNNGTTVSITDYKDGTCDFLIPDLNVLGMPLGSIEMENVTVQMAESGNKTYDGYVEGMSLMGGAIKANVTLTGSITAEGIASMDIDVVWLNGEEEMPINVTFTTEKVALDTHDGMYCVERGGEVLVEKQKSTLTLYLSTDENVSNTMVLSDIRFSENGVEQNFGTVVLDGVKMSGDPTADMTFSGTVENVALANGKTATVTVDGKRNVSLEYNIEFAFTIEGVEYKVIFDEEGLSGVEDVAAAGVVVNGAEGKIVVSGFNGQVEVYALDGVKVAQTAVAGNGEIKLARGIYVVRAGNQAVKVAVK